MPGRAFAKIIGHALWRLRHDDLAFELHARAARDRRIAGRHAELPVRRGNGQASVSGRRRRRSDGLPPGPGGAHPAGMAAALASPAPAQRLARPVGLWSLDRRDEPRVLSVLAHDSPRHRGGARIHRPAGAGIGRLASLGRSCLGRARDHRAAGAVAAARTDTLARSSEVYSWRSRQASAGHFISSSARRPALPMVPMQWRLALRSAPCSSFRSASLMRVPHCCRRRCCRSRSVWRCSVPRCLTRSR